MLATVRLDPSEYTTEEALWEAFRDRGEAAAREKLIRLHMKSVFFAMKRVRAKLWMPPDFTDDFLSAGTIRLIELVDAFDPARGIPFHSFALHPLQGAMMDAARQWQGDVSWWSHAQQTRIRGADAALRARLQRAPSPAEIAREAGMRESTVTRYLDSLRTPLPWETCAAVEDDAEITLADVVASPDPDALEALLWTEQLGIAWDLVQETLNAREQKMVLDRYAYDRPVKEIAREHGLAAQSVRQITVALLRRLRSRMERFV